MSDWYSDWYSFINDISGKQLMKQRMAASALDQGHFMSSEQREGLQQ